MDDMIKIPRRLQQGDTIAIIAPAGLVEKDEIEKAITIIQSWGLNVQRGKSLYKRHGIFAGTDAQRLADIQQALDNPSVKAVICARGGYGMTRILDKIDFTKFRQQPKWIIGYSDITALHLHINCNYGICTLHGEMPLNFHKNEEASLTLTSLKDSLFSDSPSYRWTTNDYRTGNTEGILTGGNLSLIYSLLGTDIKKCLSDKVLFIEETGEYLYAFDRMITALKLSGVFKNIKGLIVGGLNNLKQSAVKYSSGPGEILLESISEYNFPVAFDFPAGHIMDNRTLMLGSKVSFETNKGSASLDYIRS